jgi:DNA-directed RNA polymerase specialized sigma24 family protein
VADDTRNPGKDSDIDVLLVSKDPCLRKLGFEMSVDRYGKQIMAFVIVLARRYGRWLKPKDAYQETFVCFFEMVDDDRYKPQGKVGSVLFRIARHRVANFGRQRGSERIDWSVQIEEMGVPHADPTPLEGLENLEKLKWLKEKLRPAVWDGLDTLTTNEWVVYTTWLDLFDESGNIPTLDMLVEELYDWPATAEDRKKLKDNVRKTRNSAQARLCKYLARRDYRP